MPIRTPLLFAAALLAACASVDVEAAGQGALDSSSVEHEAPDARASARPLGAFSVSLAVADLAASREFYERLGFEAAGGMPEQGWQIMRSGDTVIGLFQGMFEQNILTFNPGWSQQATAVESFTDVRDIQRRIVAAGITPQISADMESAGPTSFVLVDPDGNPVLFDQHVPRPE